METHKLTQDEWNALLDEEKIPMKQEPQRFLVEGDERGRAIAEEALKTINGERQDRYGDPEDNFQIIADLWTAYLKALVHDMPPLTKEDVANMMVLFKMARIVGGMYCKDNDVDMLGYAMLGADIREGRNAD